MKEDMDAPGLKWRQRADGGRVPYWVARTDIAKRGYEPKTVRLHYAPDDLEAIASRCRVLQAEMLEWSKIGAKPIAGAAPGTIAHLVEMYQTSEFSPYRAVKWNTRRQYDLDCAKLSKAVGKRLLSAVTFADIHRWYETAKRPKKEGQPEQLRSAHGLMTMLRMVVNFGVLAEVPECDRLAGILSKARFKVPKPRKETPSLDQVRAIIDAAHAAGAHSIAFGQALQFEGMFRQSSVTGQWEPAENSAGGIRLNGRRWADGLTWAHLDSEGLIDFATSKTGREMKIDTTLYPLISAEIARVKQEDRIGPMIIDERSGLPYSEKEYSKRWRKIATAAGVPKEVWNRDSRAGGITEGRDAGAAVEDVSKHAAHTDATITSRVYDRGELEASRRVATKRKEHRERVGNV
ncbi:hypothetical protein [Kaistia sp. MMO-174]|uniref:hypothetical protein n=1 Tax=Kaistia sp. MMO-174 TaxID=3081256 RepID=UPI00301A1DCE